MKKILVLFTTVSIMSITVFAQAPGIFNYQGVARNTVGNVLQNKAITLRLSIRDLTATGTTVYAETRSVTTNQFGLFNVQVGSAGAANVTGTVAGVNWNIGAKFIQVEIDPNGGSTFVNIGTTQMASVPYALSAGSAGPTGAAGGDLAGTYPDPLLKLPLVKSQANTVALFDITNSGAGASFSGINTGTGRAGLFNSTNAANTTNAVDINVAGTGYALQASSTSAIPKALRTVGSLQLTGIGEAPNRVLTSDATGNASWQPARTASDANVGFGSWGDCSMNNVTDYNPVWDTTGDVNDNFGIEVSISGNYAIVGTPADEVGTILNQGSASIYQYNGTNWVLMQKITDATGDDGDAFGSSVSISGNYVIVGAPADNAGASINRGSASIYQYDGTNWVLMQKITDATGSTSDAFGWSVSISGNHAIVGARYDDIGLYADQGSASIYQYNGTTWVLMEKIVDPTADGSDSFGASVSISGTYAIVGSPADQVGANIYQGSASIFHYNGTNWTLIQKITDLPGNSLDVFGYSVSISGNYFIVGTPPGTVNNPGFASIYRYGGTNWVLMQKITDAPGNGDGVSISGNYAIVGACINLGPGTMPGSATIYQRIGLGWQKLQYITDPGGSSNDFFGTAVAIDGSNQRFLIGAHRYGSGSGKVIFGKLR